MFKSLRHYLQTNAKGITPSIARSREARKKEVLGCLPSKDEKRASSVRLKLETVPKANVWEYFRGTVWSTYMGIPEQLNSPLEVDSKNSVCLKTVNNSFFANDHSKLCISVRYINLIEKFRCRFIFLFL